VRDATHVLDGLLNRSADIRLEEHHTGTSGATEQIRGLCCCRFRFAPRLRDLVGACYLPGSEAVRRTPSLIAGEIEVTL
jgi:TnpA family transposase